MLNYSQKASVRFFTKGRENIQMFIFLSQSCFELPKIAARDECNINLLLKQVFKKVEVNYRDNLDYENTNLFSKLI